MNARFYAPHAHESGDLITLPDDEAEHLTRVLRMKAGDTLRVFNGHGREFEARVERAGKRGVHVRLGSVAATYALEHLGGQSHAYTWREFQTRYEEHFGPLPTAALR